MFEAAPSDNQGVFKTWREIKINCRMSVTILYQMSAEDFRSLNLLYGMIKLQ